MPDLGHHVPDLNAGWLRNPMAVARTLASLPHPGELRGAAPAWMGDGLTGDLQPYLSYYEVEVPNWKARTAEPPYISQVGNNCTSRGLADGVELLQFLEVADPPADATDALVFDRICVEATYAFGLSVAGLVGDNGCDGSSMARGAREIGLVSYPMTGGPAEETAARLRSWAANPPAVVAALKAKAAPFAIRGLARVTTWEELCAAIANRAIITMASDVGYATPRDDRGICRRRGVWGHQMFIGGIIRSDGVETAVQFQSWGPDQPAGPRPFGLPSFAFRCLRADVEAQLADQDCWAVRLFPGFERTPIASRWTNSGWGG